MSAKRKIKTTKLDIIHSALKYFMNIGYSATSPRMVCDELDISTGNITYYFPTKEHLLAELTGMLCDFQWKLMDEEADEGISSLLAVCLEFAVTAASCEDDEIAKDFYVSAYTSPVCLGIIRKNDMVRAKQVFGQYCPQWNDGQFAAAEMLVSGIEYAAFVTDGRDVPLEMRITTALDTIMSIYCIPQEVRRIKIEKVLSRDYHSLARSVLQRFRGFIEQQNEEARKQLIESKNKTV
ncbi:MAG: TetR/AcrR family transcriptional regulator [Oscillospiraceae bacterium]|nr:TetR/AcrR family transcriptional regulator [Oscillospiraceae bacterium]